MLLLRLDMNKRKHKTSALFNLMNTKTNKNQRASNGWIFFICVLVWFFLDRITKIITEHSFAAPGRGSFSLDHLIRFDLVHNTGAAWGSFSDSTNLIAVFTAVLCLVILIFALYEMKQASSLEMIALALIFAGGIGNLFDRVVNGYVVDMITPLFVSFPTFNVADIGVTCGVILFVFVVGAQFISLNQKMDASKHEEDKD